eukprot:3934495-Rhodomonas_salina.1
MPVPEHLDLGRNYIGNDGIGWIAGRSGLRHSYAMPVTDIMYAATRRTIILPRNIRLSCYSAATQCLVLKFGGQDLKSLDLSGNELGNGGMERLARGLGGCLKLTHLNLSSNVIGHEGLGCLRDGIKECGSLVSLRLGDNKAIGNSLNLAAVVSELSQIAILDVPH